MVEKIILQEKKDTLYQQGTLTNVRRGLSTNLHLGDFCGAACDPGPVDTRCNAVTPQYLLASLSPCQSWQCNGTVNRSHDTPEVFRSYSTQFFSPILHQLTCAPHHHHHLFIYLFKLLRTRVAIDLSSRCSPVAILVEQFLAGIACHPA